MPNKALWVIVQHSGCGYGEKPGFKQGLELRSVDTKTAKMRVLNAGGLLFNTYMEASNFCDDESYPNAKDYDGLYPRAPGTFSRHKIDDLKIYLPKDKQRAVKFGALIEPAELVKVL